MDSLACFYVCSATTLRPQHKRIIRLTAIWPSISFTRILFQGCWPRKPLVQSGFVYRYASSNGLLGPKILFDLESVICLIS